MMRSTILSRSGTWRVRDKMMIEMLEASSQKSSRFSKLRCDLAVDSAVASKADGHQEIIKCSHARLDLLSSGHAIAGDAVLKQAIQKSNPMPCLVCIQGAAMPPKFDSRTGIEDVRQIQAVIPARIRQCQPEAP